MGQLLLPLPCQEALPSAGWLDNSKALVAPCKTVAERGLEDASNQAASGEFELLSLFSLIPSLQIARTHS